MQWGCRGLTMMQRRHLRRWRPERQQSDAAVLDVGTADAVFAFVAAQARTRDDAAEIAVAVLVLDQQHDGRTVLQMQLAADDQRQVVIARGIECAHDAGQ